MRPCVWFSAPSLKTCVFDGESGWLVVRTHHAARARVLPPNLLVRQKISEEIRDLLVGEAADEPFRHEGAF